MQNPEVVSNGRISSKPYFEFLSIFAGNKVIAHQFNPIYGTKKLCRLHDPKILP
jgi:hypothetical protein